MDESRRKDERVSDYERDYERMSVAMNATDDQAAELVRVAESMAPSLTDFLLARIAEDEEVALEAMGYESRVSVSPVKSAAHYARWDPDRVHAECDAKRGIVEAYQLVDAHVRAVALANPDEARDARNTRAGLQVSIQALALPYADHPDYREEWRP